MDIEDYIKKVEDDSSQEMLIDPNTGQLWGVDKGALRDRGYPEGDWMLLEDVSKAVLAKLIYKLRGIDTIDENGESDAYC